MKYVQFVGSEIYHGYTENGYKSETRTCDMTPCGINIPYSAGEPIPSHFDRWPSPPFITDEPTGKRMCIHCKTSIKRRRK